MLFSLCLLYIKNGEETKLGNKFCILNAFSSVEGLCVGNNANVIPNLITSRCRTVTHLKVFSLAIVSVIVNGEWGGSGGIDVGGDEFLKCRTMSHRAGLVSLMYHILCHFGSRS